MLNIRTDQAAKSDAQSSILLKNTLKTSFNQSGNNKQRLNRLKYWLDRWVKDHRLDHAALKLSAYIPDRKVKCFLNATSHPVSSFIKNPKRALFHPPQSKRKLRLTVHGYRQFFYGQILMIIIGQWSYKISSYRTNYHTFLLKHNTGYKSTKIRFSKLVLYHPRHNIDHDFSQLIMFT